jgi:hypothetical protein
MPIRIILPLRGLPKLPMHEVRAIRSQVDSYARGARGA